MHRRRGSLCQAVRPRRPPGHRSTMAILRPRRPRVAAPPLSPCAASMAGCAFAGGSGWVCGPAAVVVRGLDGRLCLRRRVRVGLWPGRSCCARLDEPILLLRRPGRVGSGPAAPSLCAALMAVLLSRQVWVGWRPAGVAVRGIDGGRSSSPARPRGLRQRPPRGRARWSANPWPPLRVWPVRACPPPCASRRFAVLPRRPPCAARIPVGGGQPPWTIAARGRQLHHRRSLPYAGASSSPSQSPGSDSHRRSRTLLLIVVGVPAACPMRLTHPE